MIDRLPPQNIEAEQSILAACLLFPDLCEQAIENLTPAEFYRTAHQIIFRAIIDLCDRKEPVDLITVKTHIETQGRLKESQGAAYLASLTEIPIPSSISAYCRMVRECALSRCIIEKSNGAINACYRGEDPEYVISTYTDELNILIQSGSGDNFVGMEDLTLQSADRYETMRQKKEKGIKTGFWELDSIIGGLKGSKLIIIAARPRIGKTALMCNLVANLAKQRVMSGVFSIEMEKEELDDRWNSSESGVNSMSLSIGYGPTDLEWLKLQNIFESKIKWPVIIDDTGGLHIQELKRRARKMKKMGCQIIFIDQLSKIKAPGPDYERYTTIIDELGTLKKELRIPVVLLTQIRRQIEDREVKMPQLSDLKSTGRIEEEADIVMFIHRGYEYHRQEGQERVAVLDIAKHRGGPTRSIVLDWDKRTTTFRCIEPKGVL